MWREVANDLARHKAVTVMLELVYDLRFLIFVYDETKSVPSLRVAHRFNQRAIGK